MKKLISGLALSVLLTGSVWAAPEVILNTLAISLPGNPVAQEKINGALANWAVQMQQAVADREQFYGPLGDDRYLYLDEEKTFQNEYFISVLVASDANLMGRVQRNVYGEVFYAETGEPCSLSDYYGGNAAPLMAYITGELEARGIAYDRDLANWLAENGGWHNYYLNANGDVVLIFNPGDLIAEDAEYTEFPVPSVG